MTEIERRIDNNVLDFPDDVLLGMLDRWAADQRERQSWNDEDHATYRYCANLLEAAADRIRTAHA